MLLKIINKAKLNELSWKRIMKNSNLIDLLFKWEKRNRNNKNNKCNNVPTVLFALNVISLAFLLLLLLLFSMKMEKFWSLFLLLKKMIKVEEKKVKEEEYLGLEESVSCKSWEFVLCFACSFCKKTKQNKRKKKKRKKRTRRMFYLYNSVALFVVVL